MLKEDKQIAVRYDTICESKYSKVAIKTLDKVPSLLRELKNIKSEYDKRYGQWLQANNLEDSKDSKYKFFRDVGNKENKVVPFFNKILDIFIGGEDALLELDLANDEFLSDLETFLHDYVINVGNVPVEVLDRIVDNLFEMLDVTRTAYPTPAFSKMFLNFIKMYPNFADGSGYTDAIINYNRWPGRPVKNDDVQNENIQKAHKLQQMVNKDEQVKLKIKEWDETLSTIIINLNKLEGLSNDAGLKAFYNECYGRMQRGEDVESYEEDFVSSVLGLKENLIDIINQMRFK
jgi:hypothetical protein